MIQWNELASRWEMGLVRDEKKISRGRSDGQTLLVIKFMLTTFIWHCYVCSLVSTPFPPSLTLYEISFLFWEKGFLCFFLWFRERERESCQIYDDDDCQLSFPFLERSTSLNQHFFILSWLQVNQKDNWFCNVYKLLRFLSKLLT